MVHEARTEQGGESHDPSRIGVWGARTLEVTGRKSGQLRRNPVNLLTIDGRNYLVAPREKPSGPQRARRGRQTDINHRTPPTDLERHGAHRRCQTQILRQYLRRWKAEVGMFFAGVGPDSTDEHWPPSPPATPYLNSVPRM